MPELSFTDNPVRFVDSVDNRAGDSASHYLPQTMRTFTLHKQKPISKHMKTDTQNHTPGPWFRLDQPENSLEDARILTHITNGAHIICTLGTTCKDGSPNHAANARLIASIPELLSALEFLLADYLAIGGESLTGSSVPADKARAALRKAKRLA